MTNIYFEKIRELLQKVEDKERQNMGKAAGVIADSIMDDGVIHVFGSGHSHVLAEEIFFRAGGLMPINAILEPGLMVYDGASASSRLERLEGLAEIVLDKYEISEKDVLIVISNSGINAVPLEIALEAKKRGLQVIAVTSVDQSKNSSSRHSSGERLFEVADIVIDNHGERGDAALGVPGMSVKVGPTSTVIGACILHSIMHEVALLLAGKGVVPPILVSANVPGSDEHNYRLISRYKDRLRHI